MRVAILEPFYNETSCMAPGEREIYGYMASYIEIFGEEDPISLLLKYVFQPAIKKIGVSKWPRLELTDLGFAISNRDTKTEDITGESPLDIEHLLKDVIKEEGLDEPGPKA